MNEHTEDRFWSKVNRSGPIPEERPELGPCWQWIGGINSPHGYGQFWLKGRVVPAHRFAWEWMNRKKIPAELEIDHLCRNRACVNPDHLEPVTPQTNILRGNSPSAICARVTHCPQGHLYDKENTLKRNNGCYRRCRACSRVSSKLYDMARRIRREHGR